MKPSDPSLKLAAERLSAIRRAAASCTTAGEREARLFAGAVEVLAEVMDEVRRVKELAGRRAG